EKADPHDLMKIFRPLELATIISSYIIGRKLKKRCDKKEWATISKRVAAHTEIGAFIGKYIDPIGPGVGMLAGAFRNLAWPAFAIDNLEEFQKYRRNLVTAKLLFNGKAETARWHCTCVDTGAAYLQKFGFGLSLSNGFLHGLQDRSSELESDIAELDKAFYYAGMWLESMATEAKAPQQVADAAYKPNDEGLEELKSLAELINKDGSEFDWMSKGEDDISPKETPELFDKGRPYYGDIELPRHLKEQLEAHGQEQDEA
ncbi:MAG: hypothetical protein KDD62_15920, partial [Bdellovibrionales bacterium]|nr:hypothetical protein [Bdellovibrionales bacterium]